MSSLSSTSEKAFLVLKKSIDHVSSRAELKTHLGAVLGPLD